MKSLFKRLLSLCLCLLLVAVALPVSQAEAYSGIDPLTGLKYYTQDDTVIISGCSSERGGHIIIPDTIDGLPVTRVGRFSFHYTEATQVTVPASVDYVDYGAFEDAFYLRNIVFLGDAPYIHPHAFGVKPQYGEEGLAPEPFRGTVSYPAHSSGWEAVSSASYDYPNDNWVAIHNRAEGDEGTLITAPTCTTDGKIRYTCTVCSKTVTETATALGHSWDEGTLTSPPTCTTDGRRLHTCTACGKTTTKTVRELGHSWEKTLDPAPTCTTDGRELWTCTLCDYTRTTTVSALGHSWDEGTVITQPTCTQDGVRRYTCGTCSETREETISARHERGESIVTIPATCTQSGQCIHPCANCSYIFSIETLPATGHQFQKGVWLTQPGCETTGQKSYTCSTCGYIKYANFPATGHSEVTDPAIAATCTTSGLTEGTHCSTCNEVLVAQESIPATGHSYKTAVVNPTCTEIGSIANTCTRCGDVIVGTIPATGHQFEDGSCIHCGLKSLPVEGVCGDDLRWYLSEDGTLTISGTGPMYPYAILEDGDKPNTPWYSYRQFIRNVVIEPGATTVGEYAFHGCAEITGVTLPETVTDIGKLAFYGCTGLTELTLPEGVITIGSAAFRRCGNLTSVTLPESVTAIGKIAFFDCTGLTQILIPKGVASIGEYAFGNCTGLKAVTFTGSAPTMDGNSLKNVTAAATYPCGNETWTDAVTQSYGGSLIWEAAHSYESTEQPATCTQPGQTVHTCQTCGDINSAETAPATGHSEVTDPAIAATCTTSGLTEGTHCSTCNKVLTAQEPIPATGHQFEDGSCIHCGEPEAVSLPGDVNGDGKVNIMDVAKLYAHIKGTLLIEDETQLRQADLTGDGNVNILDIAKLYASVKGTE